jgi:hypothetical protein
MQGDRSTTENKANMTTAMIGRVVSPSDTGSASPGRTDRRTVSVKDVQLLYDRPQAQGQFKDVFVAAFALDTMIKVLDRRWPASVPRTGCGSPSPVWTS